MSNINGFGALFDFLKKLSPIHKLLFLGEVYLSARDDTPEIFKDVKELLEIALSKLQEDWVRYEVISKNAVKVWTLKEKIIYTYNKEDVI